MSLLIRVFLVIKLVQLLILCVAPVKFDTSSDNYLQFNGLENKMLNNFIVWDNVYFNKLFNRDDLIFEHEYVFSPNFTKLIRIIPASFYTRLTIAIIITNLAHLLTCIMVSKLSLLIFKGDAARARMSSVFCALSVAGVFLTTSYSESSCALLTVSSLYLRESSLIYTDRVNITNFKRYFLSGLLISISFGIRSNSLLFGIVYLYDVVYFTFGLFDLKNIFKALITGYTIFLSLCQSVGSAYIEFCPDRGEWCFEAIPSLMVYAQGYYWNNGFLKYWTSNNIPNFLFMLPNFLIFILSVISFRNNKKLRPLLLVSIVYLFLNLFFWHVQIMNRISTFIPLNYYYLSNIYYRNRTILNLIIYYNVVWIVVQSGLFALFLPPA